MRLPSWQVSAVARFYPIIAFMAARAVFTYFFVRSRQGLELHEIPSGSYCLLSFLCPLEVRSYPSTVTDPPVEHDSNRYGDSVAIFDDADLATERIYLERLEEYAARGTDRQSHIPILLKFEFLT